jgi:hypothetical protein
MAAGAAARRGTSFGPRAAMARSGQSPAAGTSRTDACTARSSPGAMCRTWNTTARARSRSAAGGSSGVNQNSWLHPARRYRTTGPNGPADSAIAANTPCPASARSVTRAGNHTGRRHAGVRGSTRRLNPTSTRPPAATPAQNHSRPNAPASPRGNTAPARPATATRAPRASSRQVTVPAACGAARHWTHPQPPGTRLAPAYPSSPQNPAPSPAMAAPPSAGYTPAQTIAPTAHSRRPMAGSARCHRRLVTPSARRTALSSGTRRAARYSLLAPATTSRAPQLATHPANSSGAPEPVPAIPSPAFLCRLPGPARRHVRACSAPTGPKVSPRPGSSSWACSRRPGPGRRWPSSRSLPARRTATGGTGPSSATTRNTAAR